MEAGDAGGARQNLRQGPTDFWMSMMPGIGTGGQGKGGGSKAEGECQVPRAGEGPVRVTEVSPAMTRATREGGTGGSVVDVERLWIRHMGTVAIGRARSAV